MVLLSNYLTIEYSMNDNDNTVTNSIIDHTIKKSLNMYGAKGAWTNLHVAVLAHDGSLPEVSTLDAAMEVEIRDELDLHVNQRVYM